MLRNIVLISIFCVMAAAFVPMLNGGAAQSGNQQASVSSQSLATPVVARVSEPEGVSVSGRSVKIPADDRGHFVADFKINGRPIEAMVDTGATYVAFNITTARRLGLNVNLEDMKHTVDTANGKARATVVTVERMEIGRIMLENVNAVVLEDKALNTVLIGMSFLKQLNKFQVADGTLVLSQ